MFLHASTFVLIQKWSKKSRTIKGIFACTSGFSSKKSACENYLVACYLCLILVGFSAFELIAFHFILHDSFKSPRFFIASCC
ncbi:MAG TPA: hypothetical protein PLF48_09545, partial [Chitinophagales bacterium]|nr:hypothetical protein [Chitinophagales bacterium]